MVVPTATNYLALRHQARARRMARTLFQVGLDRSKHRLSRQLFFHSSCRRSGPQTAFTHSSPTSMLSDMKYLLIVANSRSPHLTLREAFPLHRFEVIFDHPQILFQCVVSNDALSEVESKIFQYCDAFFWKNGLTLLANFRKSALEPYSGNVTYQNTYGGSRNRPDITARQEYPERKFVSSGSGLMASDLEAGLLQEPAEGVQQTQLMQLENSPMIEECAEEAETLLWNLSSMGGRGSNVQVNLQRLTEDLAEQDLYQESSEGNLQLQLEDVTMKLRRAEEARKSAEQGSAELGNAVETLRAQLQDLIAALEQEKAKTQNLRSQSRTKTQELIIEKHRADAAEQELIKLQREQDRHIESRRVLLMRLNDAEEDKNKQQQEYDDVMNDLTTQQKEERCQMIAKLKHEYEATIEDLTAKLDLANTMVDEKQTAINKSTQIT